MSRAPRGSTWANGYLKRSDGIGNRPRKHHANEVQFMRVAWQYRKQSLLSLSKMK